MSGYLRGQGSLVHTVTLRAPYVALQHLCCHEGPVMGPLDCCWRGVKTSRRCVLSQEPLDPCCQCVDGRMELSTGCFTGNHSVMRKTSALLRFNINEFCLIGGVHIPVWRLRSDLCWTGLLRTLMLSSVILSPCPDSRTRFSEQTCSLPGCICVCFCLQCCDSCPSDQDKNLRDTL